MEILEACPANAATGGPEAIHQFISELNKQPGIHARVWYWDAYGDPCPDEYKKYGCEYVTRLPDDYDVLIFPEIWAACVGDYPRGIKCIHWLGIDAYPIRTPREKLGSFLGDVNIVHIAQSEYAKDFLKKLGVKYLFKCTDTLNDDFYEEYEEEERSDTILYNPAKATDFQRRLMAECSDMTFKPIKGMTRAEVINAMRHAKLYLDFGEFPGRERIPREAGLCGCCLITSKIGSAAYDGDFAHDYKFESKDGHIWAIKHKIQYVLEHYEECSKDFGRFREQLKNDRENVPEQVKGIARALNEIFNNNSGI